MGPGVLEREAAASTGSLNGNKFDIFQKQKGYVGGVRKGGGE